MYVLMRENRMYMDPQLINHLRNKKVETHTYITNYLVRGGQI